MDKQKLRETEHLKTMHEPLVHVSKRPVIPWQKAWMIRGLAILAAFLFAALLSAVAMGASPLDFFKSIFKGSFGNSLFVWKFVKNVAVLLCISLAVTPAFRMKFWNIGANGQVLIGALCAITCVIYLGSSLPNWALLIVMFFAAVLGGMLWAVIPAIFKAIWNTNETLFTLMMNYIASYLVLFFLQLWSPNGETSLKEQSAGHLPEIRQIPGLAAIDERGYLLLILIVAVLTVGMFIYLRYSKHGYEISVVGESEKTARYIGINVRKVIIRTMLVSGAICGVAGFLIVSALDHSITTETVGGRGFTAIMVSWLANFNPFYMVMTSSLIVFLSSGAADLQTTFGVSSAFPDMITGIILFFVLGSEFFIHYRVKFRKKHSEKGGV